MMPDTWTNPDMTATTHALLHLTPRGVKRETVSTCRFAAPLQANNLFLNSENRYVNLHLFIKPI